jgi:hypothetical protein
MKTKPNILHNDDLRDMDDDVLLARTPDDVVAVLGFDPLDDVPDEEITNAVTPAKPAA